MSKGISNTVRSFTYLIAELLSYHYKMTAVILIKKKKFWFHGFKLTLRRRTIFVAFVLSSWLNTHNAVRKKKVVKLVVIKVYIWSGNYKTISSIEPPNFWLLIAFSWGMQICKLYNLCSYQNTVGQNFCWAHFFWDMQNSGFFPGGGGQGGLGGPTIRQKFFQSPPIRHLSPFLDQGLSPLAVVRPQKFEKFKHILCQIWLLLSSKVP